MPASMVSGIAVSIGGNGDSAAIIASSCSLPHHPQLDEAVTSRGVGSGACPPVSTVTTLNSLAIALALLQYRTPVTGAPASSPSVKQNPTASSKSLPGVRIVVLTTSPSSWIVIGSSTINVSGRRCAPSSVTRRTRRRCVR